MLKENTIDSISAKLSFKKKAKYTLQKNKNLLWHSLLRNLKDVLHEEESDSGRKVWEAKRNDKEIGKHVDKYR